MLIYSELNSFICMFKMFVSKITMSRFLNPPAISLTVPVIYPRLCLYNISTCKTFCSSNKPTAYHWQHFIVLSFFSSWVPVNKRPSARHVADTTTPPVSSNGSDGSRPQSYIHKASSPGKCII